MLLEDALSSTTSLVALLEGFERNGVELDREKLVEGEVRVREGSLFIVLREWWVQQGIEDHIDESKLKQVFGGLSAIAAFKRLEAEGMIEQVDDVSWCLTEKGRANMDDVVGCALSGCDDDE